MAEKLGLKIGTEVRELKIGQSFTNPKSTAFHSVKYDFKPASVDKNKIATVDVGSAHQVTVTVPHLDGAGVPQTVFKGSQRPYQKECVLIIDRVTGEITLEKLACNIQVKKTRSESTRFPLPQDRLSQGSSNSNDRGGGGSSSSNLISRSNTPPAGGQRISNKTKVTSGSRRPDRPITNLVPKHSPLHASPSYPSPNHLNNKSPKQELRNNHESQSQSTLASLPMIGMDDFIDPPTAATSAPPPPATNSARHSSSSATTPPALAATNGKMPKSSNSNSMFNLSSEIGEISDSSSSSSDNDDDDSDDSDPDRTVIERRPPIVERTNGHHTVGVHQANNGPTVPAAKFAPSVPSNLLNEDLCLSESGSDSD